jgi:hypothetical protein
MIGAMQGGMFFYLYPVSDPTSVLTSAARVVEGFGLDLALLQPATRLLVADYTLTGVTGSLRPSPISLECTAREYADESVITTVSIRMPTVSGAPDPLRFPVDRILPNAGHQVVAVPPTDRERWVAIGLEVPSACVVFVSAVTVHVA